MTCTLIVMFTMISSCFTSTNYALHRIRLYWTTQHKVDECVLGALWGSLHSTTRHYGWKCVWVSTCALMKKCEKCLCLTTGAFVLQVSVEWTELSNALRIPSRQQLFRWTQPASQCCCSQLLTLRFRNAVLILHLLLSICSGWGTWSCDTER